MNFSDLFQEDLVFCYTKSGKKLYLDLSQENTVSGKREFNNFCDESYANRELSLYKHVLSVISKDLNKVHSLNYEDRQWEALIGSWLIHFISNIHFRFFAIEEFISQNKDEIICLTPNSFAHRISRDYSDYMKSVEEIPLNLSMVSDIFSYKISDSIEMYPDDLEVCKANKNYLKGFIRKIIGKIVNSLNSKVSIYISTFNFLDYVKILIRSNFKIRPYMRYEIDYSNLSFDFGKRQLLGIANREDYSIDSILRFLIKIYPKYIPLAYLEGLKSLRKEILTSFPGTFVTDTGIYHSEVFKINLMESFHHNVKLIIVQHGGSYGMLREMQLQDFEIKMCDEYWTWGWGSEKENRKLKVMPSHLLSKLKRTIKTQKKYNVRSNQILLVLTELPRFQNRNSSIPTGWIFFKSIKKAVSLIEEIEKKSHNLVVRYYPRDRGWNFAKLVSKFNSTHNRDKSSYINFYQYKFLITDAIGTTILEAMVLNEYPILFLDSDLWKISDEFQEILPALINANFVFTSAEKLNTFLSGNDSQVASFEVREEAKKLFINKFARNENNWIDIWVEELLKVEKA